MRARLTYSLLSPRAPRRYSGYLVGLILSVVGVTLTGMAGYVAPIVSHAAFGAVVAVAAR